MQLCTSTIFRLNFTSKHTRCPFNFLPLLHIVLDQKFKCKRSNTSETYRKRVHVHVRTRGVYRNPCVPIHTRYPPASRISPAIN